MIGKVISVNYSDDNKYAVVLEDVKTSRRYLITMEDISEDYVGKFVSIYQTITVLSNSDFNHVYPEGTIGTF